MQLQPFIISSFLTQKQLNYHLKGTTSEKSAELYGEGNERQLCVGDTVNSIFVLDIAVFFYPYGAYVDSKYNILDTEWKSQKGKKIHYYKFNNVFWFYVPQENFSLMNTETSPLPVKGWKL